MKEREGDRGREREGLFFKFPLYLIELIMQSKFIDKWCQGKRGRE
jgi:hypothetical protein